MKASTSITSLVTCLLIAGCTDFLENDMGNEPTTIKFTLDDADSIDFEEYTVCSEVLLHQFTNNEELMVRQRTNTSISLSTGNSFAEMLKSEIEGLDTFTIEQYIEKNDTNYYLKNDFQVGNKTVLLMSDDELNYFFGTPDPNADWKKFHEFYPNINGFVDFTRVGFNGDKTQALVEMGHYYGTLGAEGRIYFLVKEEFEWKVVQVFSTWVS